MGFGVHFGAVAGVSDDRPGRPNVGPRERRLPELRQAAVGAEPPQVVAGWPRKIGKSVARPHPTHAVGRPRSPRPECSKPPKKTQFSGFSGTQCHFLWKVYQLGSGFPEFSGRRDFSPSCRKSVAWWDRVRAARVATALWLTVLLHAWPHYARPAHGPRSGPSGGTEQVLLHTAEIMCVESSLPTAPSPAPCWSRCIFGLSRKG